MVNTVTTPDDEFVTLEDLALELCNGGVSPKVLTQGTVLVGDAALKAANSAITAAKKLGPPTRAEALAFLRTPLDQSDPGLTGWPTVKYAMSQHCTQIVARKAMALISRIGLAAK